MKNHDVLRSKILGSMLGGITGDAFGSPFEFKPRDSYVASPNMEYNTNFNLPAGSFTDDSSMMLCLAKSLTEKGFDPVDQMQKYSWWRVSGYMSVDPSRGCFDIGRCTSMSISDYLYDQRLNVTPKDYYGNKGEYFSGNGGIMRISPAILYASDQYEKCIQNAVNSSRVTHASPECLQAAALMAHIMFNFLKGKPIDSMNLSDEDIQGLNIKSPAIRDIASGTYRKKKRDEIQSSGYVVHSLEAALWALSMTKSFEEGMMICANLGNDVDTICCIYGQIAGVFYGYEAIPKRWVDGLQQLHLVAEVCMGLCNAILSS